MSIKIYISLILIIIPSICYSYSFNYDNMHPRVKSIKIKILDPEREERLKRYEEFRIEREIQKLEHEEKKQTSKATSELIMELESLKPVITVIREDEVKTIVSSLFVARILYPNKWNKG